MTAQMTFGPGPFRVRTSPTGDMISLHLESQDWREAVTITRTRNELVDLVSQITVAITSHPLVPSDPDYLPDPEPRFEYGDLPTPRQPLDLRTPGQIRDEEDEAAAEHQQMIEGQR
jgi:hypothetical protein